MPAQLVSYSSATGSEYSGPRGRIGTMANLDLWVDGDWGDDTVGWSQEFAFDLPRFHHDPEYAHRINIHIQNSLKYLAKELEEIGLTTPPY